MHVVCSCEPNCQIYAVDMAFCGGEGLVTAKSNASFIMICQQVACAAAILIRVSHLCLQMHVRAHAEV